MPPAQRPPAQRPPAQPPAQRPPAQRPAQRVIAQNNRLRIEKLFYRFPGLAVLLLLLPPLLWIGIVYFGSLLALLSQSFFSIDEFSGVVDTRLTLKTYRELLAPAHLDVLLRSLLMSVAVTLGCAVIAFPIAYLTARYLQGRWKAIFYLAIMLPLWSSYLVRVYAWKLILAKEGIITWIVTKTHTTWILDAILALPVIGGPSLSISMLGTFIVFLYIWLPYMILPIQAALERVPKIVLEAANDLGASPARILTTVIMPLALPGIIAGSIFTFSLTLGDYIIPQIIGTSRYFLGQAVFTFQGTAGNLPLAAAFTVVPIVIMSIYLGIARRLGAFHAFS